MDNFCRIYTTGLLTINDLKFQISELLDLKKTSISNFASEFVHVWITTNDEFDKRREMEFPDGFLYFKYSIEFDFKDEEVKEFQVDLISKTLEWLWEQDMAAVAACDYEEKLPQSGGYKSLQQPWPKK